MTTTTTSPGGRGHDIQRIFRRHIDDVQMQRVGQAVCQGIARHHPKG